MIGSKNFNIEVTKEKTVDTENVIINFNLDHRLNFLPMLQYIYLVDCQIKEVIYFNWESLQIGFLIDIRKLSLMIIVYIHISYTMPLLLLHLSQGIED